MEAAEEEFQLEDHLNKCRCCFRTLIDEQRYVKITKIIENKFFELTQLKLFEADVFSDKICQLCSNDLDVFTQFKKDLSSKQKKLYRALTITKPEEAQEIFTEVKSEFNEFIECNPAEEEEDCEEFYNPQIIIKSEVDEVEEIELEDFEEKQGAERFRSCRHCEFKTKSRKALADHIASNHDESVSEKEQNCPVCKIKVRELNRHIKKVHLNVKNFHCDLCKHGTFFKAEMECHMKTHTKKEPQSFYCEFCSREFDKRHLLNRHIKLKHTEKERCHICPTCNKSFFTISTLKKHVESHRAKDMPCEFCGKLFSCMNNLRTHLYYHSEPKFVCEFEGCGKKFFMRKLLRAHQNVHRGQKDFACSYCEKSYFFQSHLKRHIISTHMKLKIDCEVFSCSSSFARKETYRNHVLQHHQNLGPEALEALLMKIRTMKVEEFRCVG